MSRRPSEEQLRSVKTMLASAFKEMRKYGLMAKQNFQCCMGCACSAMWTEMQKTPGKYKGAVYYHKQDGERLRNGIDFCIGFGAEDQNDTDDGTKDVLVGALAKTILEKSGLVVTWDGTHTEKLTVKFPQPSA
jgi:hypothetical protein